MELIELLRKHYPYKTDEWVYNKVCELIRNDMIEVDEAKFAVMSVDNLCPDEIWKRGETNEVVKVEEVNKLFEETQDFQTELKTKKIFPPTSRYDLEVEKSLEARLIGNNYFQQRLRGFAIMYDIDRRAFKISADDIEMCYVLADRSAKVTALRIYDAIWYIIERMEDSKEFDPETMRRLGLYYDV